MNQSILHKVSNKTASVDYEALESWKSTEDIKETFKEITQQLNNEIILYKNTFKNTLRRKEK